MSRGEATGPRVRDAMIGSPKVLGADVTTAEVRAALESDHVHMALLVDGPALVGTVTRDDLPAAGDEAAERRPALGLARLDGRTVGPDEPVERVREALEATGSRRVAVVDSAGHLLGLVCLKRHRRGYCDDAGVAARAAERSLSG